MLLVLAACSGGAVDPMPADTDPHTDADTDADTDTDVAFDPDVAGPFTYTTAGAPDAPRPSGVFVPDRPDAAPVVVVLHGFGLDPVLYGSYGARLASWGYVAVAPQLSGSVLAPTTHADLAVEVGAMLDWIASDPAVLGGIDADRIVLAGHSLGGKIAALRATTDARIDGLFLIDPVDAAPPFGSNPVDHPSVTPERMAQITVPFVALGETVNTTGAQPCAPADENFREYFLHATSPALSVELVGANHMSFLDDPDCGLFCSVCPAGSDDPVQTRRITQAAMVAYVEAVLGGRPEAHDWLVGPGLGAFVASGQVVVETRGGF
ncbi:MAG: alpha/beta fold hydrolase [Myxococcota bacterium]